jgi:phage gp45-like
MFERLAGAIRSMVTRAKVAGAIVGPRTLLQITGLNGEVKTTVELLLPPGYSARPVAGADVTVFQVGGTRDHLVAVGGDNAGGDAIANLAPGEFGLRHPGSNTQLVFRNTGTQELTGVLHVSGDVVAGWGTTNVSSLQHTHQVENVQSGGATVPTQPPTAGT